MPPSRQVDKVELFLLTSENQFMYKGLCKAVINLGTKILAVKQNDLNKTTIEIPFYYPFVMHKNFLCHVSPTKLHDIVIIFPTSQACKDIYDVLLNYQIKINRDFQDTNKFDELKDRILIPLLNEVMDDPNVCESTRNRIVKMLKPVDSMKDVKDIMVKSELSEPLPRERDAPVISQMPPIKVEIESPPSLKRENSTSAYESNTTRAAKKCKTEVPDDDELPAAMSVMGNYANLTKRFLNSTEYEIQTYCKKGTKIQKQKLIIYYSPEKDLCYSYFYETKSKRFNCGKCLEKNRYVVAHLRDGNDGEQFVELGLLTHTCTPIPYTRDPKTSDILGTMSLSSILPALPKTLNIEPNNMTLPSTSNHDRRNATNETYSSLHESVNDDNVNDLSNITLKLKTEIMEAAKNLKKDKASAILAPNIVKQTSRILKSADYELQNYFKGAELKQRLFVFYPDNRNFCFPYTYEAANRRFVCARCRRNKRLVVAHVRHDLNNDEYIELGLLNHLCAPLLYNSTPPPQNELIESAESPSDVNIASNEMPDISSDSSTPSLRSSESPAASSAVPNNSAEASKSQSSPPIFELQMVNKNGKRKPQLLVFPYSDKRLCYYYYYDTKCDYFICGKCRKRLHYVTARLQKDANGENSVKLDDKPHICLLMPYKSATE